MNEPNGLENSHCINLEHAESFDYNNESSQRRDENLFQGNQTIRYGKVFKKRSPVIKISKELQEELDRVVEEYMCENVPIFILKDDQ